MNTKKIDEALALAEKWAARVSAAEPGRSDVPSDYQFRFSKDEMFQLRAAFEQIAALLTAARGLRAFCACGTQRTTEDPVLLVSAIWGIGPRPTSPANSSAAVRYRLPELRVCTGCSAVYCVVLK